MDLLFPIVVAVMMIITAVWRQKSKRPHPIFYLEGNIGAGKSTVATGLAALGKYRVRKEPVTEWQNVDGHNFLALIGIDRKKWLYAFQTLVLATLAKRVNTMTNPGNGKPCILERSATCAMRVFAKDGHLQGDLTDEEMAVLQVLHNIMKNDHDAVYIYVRTPPEESYRRASSRGRPEERKLPREYFLRLHALMDQWLLHNETAPGMLAPTDILKETERKIEHHLKNNQ